MLRDDILSLCQDELVKLGGVLDDNRDELFNSLSSKIESEYNISIIFSTINRGSCTYITYKFFDKYGTLCKAAFKLQPDSGADTMVTNLVAIIAGSEAIEILNDSYDKYRASTGSAIDIRYQWGRAVDCSIGAWDFSNITVKLSAKAIDKLISLYTSSQSSLGLKLSGAIEQSEVGKQNIVEFIRDFDTFPIHKMLDAEISKEPTKDILSKSMLRPDDAKSIIRNNAKSMTKGTQNLLVVRVVSQLGTFIVLSNWKVDYGDKTISTSIIDDKAIDLESASIVTSYSIISRIEQVIKLSKSDIAEIFEA